jgi:transmembrane sensor
LAARVLSGEADEIDRGLFDQWLNADAANRQEWQRIRNTWKKGEEALFIGNVDTSGAWSRVRRRTIDEKTEPKRRVLPRARMIAAVAASLILAFGLAWMFLSPGQSESSSLIVSNSKREEMVLSDGSAITLNSGSEFSCEQPFDENVRTVVLAGEGYFRVEGDRAWPFVIHAGEVTIKVTGTSFNVRAFPNLDITEVAVTEGRVEVFLPLVDNPVVLWKGHTALFEKTSGALTVRESTDPNLLAWITQKINFNEAPLTKVAETLERVYGVNIQLSDSSLNEEKLTARFSENSLDFVLRVLCTTFNLEMQREGETIFLSHAGQQD